MPTFPRPEDADNPLTKIILRAVPENEQGNKTLANAAKIIGVTKWAMRKWINNQRLSPQRAMDIVEMGRIGVPEGKRGRVKREELDPFVYNV